MRAPERDADDLALVHLPISLSVKAHLQQPVLGIVPLTTTRTHQIAAPRGALMVIVLCHRERCPTAARDKEHAQWRSAFSVLLGLASGLHDSSTVAYDFFLRWFDWSVFLRRRSDLGVISTNSSSAMNS